MTIDALTGLPELPEGWFWEVIENGDYPFPGTLRLEIRKDVEEMETTTVTEELPKRWYEMKRRTTVHTQEHPVTRTYTEYSEGLYDLHVLDTENPVNPPGEGWLMATDDPTPNYPHNAYPFLIRASKPRTRYQYYRPDPATPESVRTAADNLYKQFKEQQDRDAARLREAEERAMLVGKYPPKTLKG